VFFVFYRIWFFLFVLGLLVSDNEYQRSLFFEAEKTKNNFLKGLLWDFFLSSFLLSCFRWCRCLWLFLPKDLNPRYQLANVVTFFLLLLLLFHNNVAVVVLFTVFFLFLSLIFFFVVSISLYTFSILNFLHFTMLCFSLCVERER
jgi:hypothetical protein